MHAPPARPDIVRDPLWYLGRDLGGGVLDPLTVRFGGGRDPGGSGHPEASADPDGSVDPGASDDRAGDASGGAALLLFSSAARAAAHERLLPAGFRVCAVAADDLRLKEELLRAALHRGATLVLHDPSPEELKPRATDRVVRALFEVLGEKRGRACL